MISNEQFEDWMKEVEQRPGSAALILQFVFNRLKDLSGRNEELLNENIALRSERKVEEYESTINNLEYQLELLRRQFHGQPIVTDVSQPQRASGIFVYSPKGRLLHVELPIAASDAPLPLFPAANVADDISYLRLITANHEEELLFVFDTGRTETHPARTFPLAGSAGWEEAALVEPRTNELLTALLPIAKMSLYGVCVQISRRGFARRLMMPSFQQHLQKNYIGTGIKAKPDQTCCLLLANPDERLVLVSREGYLLTTSIDSLPYTSEEMLRLSATDYIVSVFIADRQPTFAVVTQTGKVIHREASWLEPAESAKSRGQAVFSQSRRDAGVRIIGAFPVTEEDWAVFLRSDGCLSRHAVADLLQAGSVAGMDDSQMLVDLAVTPAVKGEAA